MNKLTSILKHNGCGFRLLSLFYFFGHKVKIMLFESATELLAQRRISVEVSRPPAEGGQEDICFPSPGTVAALLWGYLPHSISWRSERAPSLLLGREQRKSWCEVEGRGQEETAGNDNVCKAISLWQRPPYPGGALGATRLQPQCSVPLMSLVTPETSQCGKHSRTISGFSGEERGQQSHSVM